MCSSSAAVASDQAPVTGVLCRAAEAVSTVTSSVGTVVPCSAPTPAAFSWNQANRPDGATADGPGWRPAGTGISLTPRPLQITVRDALAAATTPPLALVATAVIGSPACQIVVRRPPSQRWTSPAAFPAMTTGAVEAAASAVTGDP